MARHVVHRRNGQVDEYQELPDAEHLEPDIVTVTFPDGSLRSYHVEDGLGGVGFEFVQAGVLVLRFEDSDHVLSAFAPTDWTSVSGTALGDRGRRSSSGRCGPPRPQEGLKGLRYRGRHMRGHRNPRRQRLDRMADPAA